MAAVSPATLRERVLRAGIWSVASYVLSQLVRFGSNLIMTRLLVPEMFAVMAIAWMVMVGLFLFADVGLQQSVVQSRRGVDPNFLNTVWAIQIRRGVVISLCACAASLLLGIANHIGLAPANTVYAQPVLPYVIAAVSVCAIIEGFASTKLLEASRNLALGRIAGIELTSQLAGFAGMLVWASVDTSVWALVAGGICSAATRTILSHVWLPGTRNRWHWDSTAFTEVVHFGKWILVSSILGFLVNNGDRLLLGALVDASTLGVYVIAYFVFRAIEQLLLKIISDVSFPALSEVARDRPSELRRGYYRIHGVLSPLAYVAAGILMMSGPELISVLYDIRYAEAGWMLAALGAALVTAPYHIATQCFMALGVPRLLPNIIAVRLVGLVLLTMLGFYFFGLKGAVFGIATSYFSAVLLTVFYLMRHKIFDARRELIALSYVFVGAAGGEILNHLLRH